MIFHLFLEIHLQLGETLPLIANLFINKQNGTMEGIITGVDLDAAVVSLMDKSSLGHEYLLIVGRWAVVSWKRGRFLHPQQK
jgi:hypothetical protein